MVTGGTASLEIGATTIFESGGTVVLTGDLRLENPVTVVEAGVSFSGGGALNNTAGRTLRLLDGANVSVLIENQGTLALGASAGQVQGLDFQQDVSGALEIELAGISLDSFDRLALTGQALLGGALNVSLLDGFNPTLGNSFTFLSAAGGITGAFDTISLPILAAGHAWSINDTPTFIQLIVTQAPHWATITLMAPSTRPTMSCGARTTARKPATTRGAPTSAKRLATAQAPL